jgi:subtilisin family serine protease
MAMDPGLIELNEAGPPDEEVSLILRLQDGAEPPPTVRVVCRFGPIITVRCRRADILPTWASDRVISVKAPRAVHLPGPVGPRRGPAEIDEAAATEMEMDPEEAEASAEAEPAPRRPPPPALPFDGRGVVVGICDWGFDFTHPNFRNADGSTRLIALWDQRGTGDPRAPAPYNRGRLFTPNDINAALSEPDPCAALGYYPSSGDPNNTGSHGTHVSDIVAGNRRYAGSEVGLASGADLVFVHLGAQRLGELDNLGDSVSLLEGLDFVRRTAAAAGRPCVLHLSAGKTGGPHCGVTLVERAVDVLLQETPGIVLVQSGGNYADTAMHTHARIGPDQTHVIDWLIPPGDRTPNELEIWYSGMDVFDVTLVAPDGQQFSAPLAQRARLGDGLEAWGNLYHRLHEPNSGLNHIAIFLYTAAPTGRWKVVVHGRDVVDGRLHAWIERDAGSRYQSRFSRAQATSSYTTNTICNSFRAIAVGAYDATHPERPPGHFSSRGPTADGRQKPEIAAPGVRILAARSMPRDGWNGERRLVVKSGTSMAAPWVSGTVALMFQAAGRPLTIHEVRRILIGTADPHAGPRGRSSSQLGFGYLNTAAAVDAARRLGSGAAPLPAIAFSLEQEEAPSEVRPVGSTWLEEPLGEDSPPAVARQNAAETQAVLRTGTLRGSGVQFYPLQMASTRIGPVSGQGGLLLDRRNRLSAILGTGMSLRQLAGLLLPLWNTAAPFTPPGGAPRVTPSIDRDVLARGLLVYNRYYLAVVSQPAPSMTGFIAGLRFPLPVEIDENGDGVVNKDLIQLWAGTFESAWSPLLDQAASAIAAPTTASLQQAVAAFLTSNPDTLSRGIAIGARAITNPTEAQPLVTEVFRQAGTGQFQLALAVMGNLVNPQIGLLASQIAGAAILSLIRNALATAPAQRTPEQQQSLDRANLMLGQVASVAAREVAYFDWSTIPRDERMVYVMNRLVQQRFPVNAAAGIVGNLVAESDVLPSRVEGSAAATPMRAEDFAGRTRDFTPEQIMNRNSATRTGPKKPGIGLGQWTSADRRAGLFQQRGATVLFDMDAQVDYLVGEIRANAGLTGRLTAAGVTVNDAADDVVYDFEIPGAILDGAGNKRPRADPAVQAVFRQRRGNAQRALQAYQAAHP